MIRRPSKHRQPRLHDEREMAREIDPFLRGDPVEEPGKDVWFPR